MKSNKRRRTRGAGAILKENNMLLWSAHMKYDSSARTVLI